MNEVIKNSMNATARASMCRLLKLELTACEEICAEYRKIRYDAKERADACLPVYVREQYINAGIEAERMQAEYGARIIALQVQIADLSM